MKRGEQATRSRHAAGAVRHAEKRRSGTCAFADRIARISLDAFRSSVPEAFRETQKQTCVATIVAHFVLDGANEEENLQVMAMGVGTKFLSEAVLRREEQLDCDSSEEPVVCSNLDTNHMKNRENTTPCGYGRRVRDSHAEVLARRAFRRQLCLEIKQNQQLDHDVSTTTTHYRPILQRVTEGGEDKRDEGFRYRLRPNVTLHMYTSSAPCGNATLKKFTKMERETFNDSLGPDEWSTPHHQPIQAHSLRLGQFALLVKKNNSFETEGTPREVHGELDTAMAIPKGKAWPANESDEWCPPGTSIVRFNKGSLHTCSDKICRWNCLGLQGSLLSSILVSPIHMSTLTVGRKLTSCICRRAVCCRALPPPSVEQRGKYVLNHPAIMGTGVYMDESGVIDMAESMALGHDVRFNSTLSWAWWPSIESNEAECIDGATGFAHMFGSANHPNAAVGVSMVSTDALLRLFCNIAAPKPHVQDIEATDKLSLTELRAFKRQVSPEYEAAKDELMTQNRIFRQWRRRENEGTN